MCEPREVHNNSSKVHYVSRSCVEHLGQSKIVTKIVMLIKKVNHLINLNQEKVILKKICGTERPIASQRFMNALLKYPANKFMLPQEVRPELKWWIQNCHSTTLIHHHHISSQLVIGPRMGCLIRQHSGCQISGPQSIAIIRKCWPHCTLYGCTRTSWVTARY